MTISSSTRTAGPFLGDGSTTALPFGFKVFATTDVLVQRTSADGAQLALTLGGDYTVALNADQNAAPGGVVTLLDPAADFPTGSSITLTSSVAATQPLSLANGGPFLAKSIEDALDRLTLLLQQQALSLDGAIRAPLVETLTELPAAATRRGKMMAFDATTGDLGLTTFTYGQVATAVAAAYSSGTAGLWINVIDYGAAGDGVADDTDAIQEAINAAGAAGGGTVFLPAGTYRVTASLEFYFPRVFFRGAGMFNTKLTRSTDYGDTITFGGGQAGSGTLLVDTGISDLTIVSTGLMTSGAHIRYSGVARHQLKGIYLNNGFIGIRAEALTAAYWSDIYLVFTNIFGGSPTGRRYLQFGAAASYSHKSCGDLFITNFNVRGNTSNQLTEFGVNIEAADGIWFENGHVGNATEANIRIGGPTTDMINLVFFSNVMTDEGTGYGLLLESYASLAFRTIKFVNCLFKSGGTPAWGTGGIVVAAGCTVSGLSFDNCTVTEFGRTGVTLGSTVSNMITFSNCTVRGNGRNIADTYAGYSILANVSSVVISGGSSGKAYDSGGTGTQSYGVQFSTGHSNILVDGVDLTGNTLGSAIGGSNTVLILDSCMSQDSTTVESGSTVTPPTIGNVITVTGTTSINNVQVSRIGRIITLLFTDTVTVNDTGNLKLAGTFNAGVDDTLTLVYDGTNWLEISRSAN